MWRSEDNVDKDPGLHLRSSAVWRVLYTLNHLVTYLCFPDALERKSTVNQLRYEVVNYSILVVCLPILLLPRNCL